MQTAEPKVKAAELAGHLARAVSRHRAGDLGAAEAAYRRILDLDSAHGDAWHLLGVLASQQGQHAKALDHIGRAVALMPTFADAHLSLGNACKALGRLDEALESYRRAVTLNPGHAVAHNNLGNLHRGQGQYEAAIDAYAEATAVKPDYFEAHYNLGVAHLDQANYGEAERASRRAVAIEPRFSPAHVCLSAALTGLGRHHEATEALKRAFALDPNNLDVLRMFAAQFEGRREIEKAAFSYLQILALRPDHEESLRRIVDIVLSLCDWRHYEAFRDQIIAGVRLAISEGSPLGLDVFNLLALPVDNQLILDASRAKSRSVSRSMAPARARQGFVFVRGDAASRPIRLGYLLPYTERHSMPMVLRGVIERHDRARFEVFGYSLRSCDDGSFSRGFRRAFDRFSDLPRAAPERAAAMVHGDRIDLLIDTTGHTGSHCLDIAAMRPAPVQAHYLGYSLTTGADFIDYLITDRTFYPPEWARFCGENLVYLPDSFMAAARARIARRPLFRRRFGLPRRGMVFCNFNHPCKLEPVVFGAWMRILAAVPGSVLWLGSWMKATRKNLWREAEARGVAPERVIFSEIVDHPVHLKRLRLADLALDTLWHGGGVTTVDALWAGLPVLTVAGETPAGRLGATLSQAAGVPDLIVPDLATYEATAVALAREPERLADIRARLRRGREHSALFDRDRYTRHLEAAYEEMWRRYVSGEAPAPISIARLPPTSARARKSAGWSLLPALVPWRRSHAPGGSRGP